MQRLVRKIAFPGLLLLCLATFATAQETSSAITIDASRLDDILVLPGPFPTQTTDDPGFADANFDDTAWPLLKAEEPLANYHLRSVVEGYAWVRIHLHILNAHGPLAIAIKHSGYAYTVYANGRQIAISAGMASLKPILDPPFSIALPPGQDVTLAIRFHHVNLLRTSPLLQLQFGSRSALSSALELARVRSFNNDEAAPLILALALVAFAAFSLALYLAQRQQLEYLWLALFCFCFGGFTLVDVAVADGVVFSTVWIRLLDASFGFYSCLCSLEFVIRFVRARASWPLRLLQLIFIVGPVEVFFAINTGYVNAPVLTLWFIALSFFLVKAYRSGNVENKLLLPPFALLALTSAWGFATQISPSLYFPRQLYLGRVGVSINDMSLLLFLIGILAVVLYRFIRVTRDEQRAAAELEAARTVQQILIPETLPVIPGYTIGSVYQPALQVGGDFFQIIPLPANAALIVLGDVSGKGMQAAMTVALLVGAVRAAAETCTSPAELLANLNRRLHGRGTGFTTCLILSIDSGGNVVAANAGHLQPYLDGHELALEPGLPLGFLPDSTYPESHITLAAGQTLTLLTDGVVEATSLTKELFGFERTQSVSRQTAQQIAAAASAFGNQAPQVDDITVLTLERLSA